MTYTGTCHWTGYGFLASLPWTGYVFFLIVLKNRVLKKIVFKKPFSKHRSIVIANKTLQNCIKQGSVYFLLCSKQGPKIEGVVLHRVCILGFFFVLKRVRV